jgi:hypothetical protein
MNEKYLEVNVTNGARKDDDSESRMRIRGSVSLSHARMILPYIKTHIIRSSLSVAEVANYSNYIC